VAERADHIERGIVTESYSPFGGGGAAVLREPVIAAVAERLGRTPGQVVAKWHLQQGLVAIPKSGNLERLRENLDLDFELEPRDFEEIAALDVHPGNDSDHVGH
jgi:2,5-diketo-D-gluconate reductase A